MKTKSPHPTRKLRPVAEVISDPAAARTALCPDCGQTYNPDHAAQVIYHTQSGPHEPMAEPHK